MTIAEIIEIYDKIRLEKLNKNRWYKELHEKYSKKWGRNDV